MEALEKIHQHPEDVHMFEKIEQVLKTLQPLPLSLDLWNAQNIYFSMGKTLYKTIKENAEGGNASARTWVEAFRKLGHYLHVRIT